MLSAAPRYFPVNLQRTALTTTYTKKRDLRQPREHRLPLTANSGHKPGCDLHMTHIDGRHQDAVTQRLLMAGLRTIFEPATKIRSKYYNAASGSQVNVCVSY